MKMGTGKIVFAVILLLASIFLFRHCHLMSPWSPFEKALTFGDVVSLGKELKANPSLANKRIRYGDTPLKKAVGCQHPAETIELLLKYGADINATGDPFATTPLQHAAWSGKTEAVKALLAHHPDVDATNDDSQNGTGDGSTALNFAFTADNKEIFDLLLAAGADINHGRAVLAECMSRGDRNNWAEFLLSRGADPNRLGPKGDRFVPIIQAVLSGNTNYVAALIRHHVDLNARYVNGADNCSPLELALEEGRLDIALMIQNYALQNCSNTISVAAANGDLDALHDSFLKSPQSIEERDVLGFTPLAWAAQGGQERAAEFLLALGADPNAAGKGGRRPIDWATSAGHLPLVELLINKGASELNDSLFFAIQQQQVQVARFLLDHGANPNCHYPPGRSISPLHLAARQGNVEAARLLLEHGADANGLEQNNSTPLEYAVGQTSKEMVEFLFAHGAKIPMKRPDYWSVFHEWALGAGDTNIANMLLLHKAEVVAKGSDGQTPLHFAARQGQLQAVEWLLQHGADVNARDNNGKTPLGMLHGRRGRVMRKDVADLLQKHGGRE
jgi:ankyrin repeat protein